MKEVLYNAFYMARRFKVASIFNLIGLIVAFTSCYLLLTQLMYQYSYNRGVDDYQRLYRMESNHLYPEWESSEHICRPLAEGLKSVPQVESFSLVWNNNFSLDSRIVVKGKHELEYVFSSGNNSAVSTMTHHLLDGTIEWTEDDRDGIIIPASIAREYFGTTQAADSLMLVLDDSGQCEKRRVQGVYEDFPKNCELPNCIYYNMRESDLTNLIASYMCYVKFTPGEHDVDEIAKRVKLAAIDSLIANSHKEGKEADPDAIEDIKKTNIKFIPLSDSYFHFTSFTQGEHGYREMFNVLRLACLLVVIISTVNFLNFTLAESPVRVRSLNTRLVLGARRSRLRMGMVAECVFTSVGACLIAVALCGMLTQVPAVRAVFEYDFSLFHHCWLVLSLLLLSIVVGVVAGTYPAIFATSFPSVLALKSSFGLTPQGRRLRTGLVFLQLFASMFMVTYIGYLFLQNQYIFNSNYGYDKNHILVCRALPSDETFAKNRDDICQTLAKSPSIRGVSLSSGIIGSTDAHYVIKTGHDGIIFGYSFMYVDRQYLSTLGIKVIEGRDFLPGDTAAIIINEVAHRQMDWLKVGDKISTSPDETPDSAIVVGVCADIRYGTMFTGNNQAFGFILDDDKYYKPEYQLNINVAPTANQDAVLQQVQLLLKKHSIDSTPVHFDEILATTYQKELRFFSLIYILSGICILITLIGVFCLTMFEAEYRRKEIGIRKVLGATAGEIVMMLCRQYVPLIVLSFVFAVPLAVYYGVSTLGYFTQRTVISWWIFPLALVIVASITLATVALKSWRTAQEPPSVSLKNE